jgi:hypothetical protein
MFDMFPQRFLEEVDKVPAYRRLGEFDPEMWRASAVQGCAIWASLFLKGHADGYRVPTQDEYVASYVDSMRKRRNFADDFAWMFEGEGGRGDPRPGLLHRMSSFYEEGVAMGMPYACLSAAFEDGPQKDGWVVYDAKADFKCGIDLFVICAGRAVWIDARYRGGTPREETVGARKAHETETKWNTAGPGTDNASRKTTDCFVLERGRDDDMLRNGFRLYGPNAINELTAQLFDYFGVHRRKRSRVSEEGYHCSTYLRLEAGDEEEGGADDPFAGL